MHSINYDDLDKISSHVYSNISAISKPTLTSVKEAILKSLGYKNLYAFKQANQNKNAGLLNHFTAQEIVSICGLSVDMENKKYTCFDKLINDLFSKIPNLDDNNIEIYTKKVDFLRFLNENNFTFFNYKWYKQSLPVNSKGLKITNTSFIQMPYLDFWNSIKRHVPLSSLSIYKTPMYIQYFLNHQAIEKKKVYTIYDFLKSIFVSVRKDSFFHEALTILKNHYRLLSSISESMDNIHVYDFDYSEMTYSEVFDFYFNFKDSNLKKIAKLLNTSSLTQEKVKSAFKKLFESSSAMNITAPIYDLDKDIKSHYDFWGTQPFQKDAISSNFEKNIILANNNIFRYDFRDSLGWSDIVFEKRISGQYYEYAVSQETRDKDHFYNSWLSNDELLFIYQYFYFLTKKEMRLNDFIYFCDNFITDSRLMDAHIPLIPEILKNQYSSSLSDSFFKE